MVAARPGSVVRYYEDFDVGETHRFGTYDVTEEEVIEFASRYDPQPIHTDPEAARESPYGGLIASGWHTSAMCMRLIVDGLVTDAAAVGAPGVDELRWREPVRPGDELSVRVEIESKRPSESRPELGIVRMPWTASRGDGTTVLTVDGVWFVARRNADAD